MTTLAQSAPEPRLAFKPTPLTPPVDVTPRWHPATLIAFRLCFVYFGLYVITTQMLPGMLRNPLVPIPTFRNITLAQDTFVWVGKHVLGISRTISIAPSGSGDKTIDWVQAFTLLVIAVIATVLWSAIAREKRSHDRLYAWFRLFIRFALGTTFLTYGLSKVIPLQMPVLALSRLVEPFGNFSPMGVLWYSVGASPAYEIFIGLAETTAGLLLFVPRTAQLGALMCLMDAIGVFAMNMTYDVPVKLFAFHLILLSLFLIAPNARRLFDLFLLHRNAALREEPPLGASVRARRGVVIAQVVFGVYALLFGLYGSMQAWKIYGGGAPKSPLFGIWDVEEMSIDGQPRPALLTDSVRWKRVIFQQPTSATFQRMSDTFKRYNAVVDSTAKTLVLTGSDSAHEKSALTYRRPTNDRLLVDGTLDGHAVHMALAFRDPDSYLVRSRGFNWIQELPYNR